MPEDRKPRWTFLTNHAHVLVSISQDPTLRGRDIAERVGITERAVQAIIADLEADGYITRTRTGRRNTYEVHPDLPLRHPLEADHSAADLLHALGLLRNEPTSAD
ncbi:MAG TPA: winged helix-turn-helix domain-containing protein [Aquihabitans sp.]|jgi:biotin operon repressor|nr:winged helix-turn-helix domain-containing protein [Aquihabitans sp.]